MHKATIEIVDPDNVEARLTICAKVKTLRRVRDAISASLSERWDNPTSEFLKAVTEAVETVDARFVGLSSEEEK